MKKTTKVTAEISRDEAMKLGSIVPSDAVHISLSENKGKFMLKYDQVEDDEPVKPMAAAAPSEMPAVPPEMPTVAEPEVVKPPKKP